jgi:hypothetical protein
MAVGSPDWIAPREGQDWVCEDTKRAVDWIKTFIGSTEMSERLDRCRSSYLKNREYWEDGHNVELFDKRDHIAWFIFQAETYAVGREFWVPSEAARIVPYIQKIGKELNDIAQVIGVEKRVARLLTSDRSQPESGIYELLVAAAYKRHGWTKVAFVEETPGQGRKPDLHVSKSGTRWAAECKRILRSRYAEKEEAIGKKLASRVHALSEEKGQALVLEVRFHEELENYSETYLADRIETFFPVTGVTENFDGRADIRLRPVEWHLMHSVMSSDLIYIGSTRMMELISGSHEHGGSHSLAVRCRRAPMKPSYADTIYHASLVSWVNLSSEAESAKANHFKRKIADAEDQLPNDRPGVVHVGMESLGQIGVDQRRHFSNYRIARNFQVSSSRLRWIYGNYFQEEVTARQHESCAMEETMAPYRIGIHRTHEPLPGHLLVADDKDARFGLHWDF